MKSLANHDSFGVVGFVVVPFSVGFFLGGGEGGDAFPNMAIYIRRGKEENNCVNMLIYLLRKNRYQ